MKASDWKPLVLTGIISWFDEYFTPFNKYWMLKDNIYCCKDLIFMKIDHNNILFPSLYLTAQTFEKWQKDIFCFHIKKP